MAESETMATSPTASRTRKRLVQAARDVFNTAGYLNTDTNKIARAAGYAPATFYKHFENKKEIFVEVYRDWVMAEWAMLRAPKSGEARSLRERLALVRDHHCRWAGFRRSLRALVSTDADVQSVRLEQRKLQLQFLRELWRDERRVPLQPQRLLLVLYAVERVCDAIADEETESLGVDKDALFDELVEWVEGMVRG